MIDEKLTILKKDLLVLVPAFLLLLVLSFGYGYFFGRHEQVEKNKSLLQVIPDVNCGSKSQIPNPKSQTNSNDQNANDQNL